MKTIRYKWDRTDTALLLSMVIPIIVGIPLFIIGVIVIHNIPISMLGVLLIGAGYGISQGAWMMRRFMIRWMISIGIKVDGKSGHEKVVLNKKQ